MEKPLSFLAKKATRAHDICNTLLIYMQEYVNYATSAEDAKTLRKAICYFDKVQDECDASVTMILDLTAEGSNEILNNSQ